MKGRATLLVTGIDVTAQRDGEEVSLGGGNRRYRKILIMQNKFIVLTSLDNLNS